MSAEKVWDITQGILDEYREELDHVFCKMGESLEARFDEEGIPMQIEVQPHCYQDSKEKLLALDKIASYISTDVYLKVDWHRMFSKGEE